MNQENIRLLREDYISTKIGDSGYSYMLQFSMFV